MLTLFKKKDANFDLGFVIVDPGCILVSYEQLKDKRRRKR